MKNDIDNFLFNWYQFPIDVWWRKKYNVSFGSQAHRDMNFIDMAIEYQESLMLIKKDDEEDDVDTYFERELDNAGITTNDNIKVTKKEIDEDYENLDLSKFDG